MTFIVVLLGWIFSLCLHEFSHALVAYLGGDLSVRDKGYLTLFRCRPSLAQRESFNDRFQ